MRKTIIENGIEYHLTGDYYLPNLTLPEGPNNVGYWGELRRKFLREHHKGIYTGMLLAGTLWDHLAETNTQAEQMMETITKEMKSAEGVTEEFKAQDPLAWIQQMNNIHARAAEIVREELIFV